MEGKKRSPKKKLADKAKPKLETAPVINCGKSSNTMHNQDLLEDLVGMIGAEDGDDEVMQDIMSTFNFGEDIMQSPQYNSTKSNNLRASYKMANGSQIRSRGNKNGWKDLTRNSAMARPGSSTNATLRDLRGGTQHVRKKSEVNQLDDSLDRNSDDIEQDMLDIEYNATAQRKKMQFNRDSNANDMSNLRIGTDEDNSQIKLIPSDNRASNFIGSDLNSRDEVGIEMEDFSDQTSMLRNQTNISQSEIIQIIEQTLYQYYLIDLTKFNVQRLLKKIDPEILKHLENKIKYKVNKESRPLNKIFIDFGPYPLTKTWQISKKDKLNISNTNINKDEKIENDQTLVSKNLKRALRENQSKTQMFIPPDEDNYKQHGIKNLVVQYDESDSFIDIDDITHKESVFYKVNMLSGVLEEYVNKLNQNLEPLKEQGQMIDRFSFMFLIFGFIATLILSMLMAYLISLWASIAVAGLYVLVLAIIFFRNNKELQFVHQQTVLTMAIITYIDNQNVFFQRGVRAQLGYMGQWIEFRKERRLDFDQIENNYAIDGADMTFKRTIHGLQNGGMYMGQTIALPNQSDTMSQNRKVNNTPRNENMRNTLNGFRHNGGMIPVSQQDKFSMHSRRFSKVGSSRPDSGVSGSLKSKDKKMNKEFQLSAMTKYR